MRKGSGSGPNLKHDPKRGITRLSKGVSRITRLEGKRIEEWESQSDRGI
jgi:hypothetical protein